MLRMVLLATLAVVAPSFLIAPLAAPRVLSRAHVSCAASVKPTDANGVEIKAALSSYMHFCAERRPSLTSELKASMGAAFNYPAVMSQLGSEWKQLSDSEKMRFESMATADKVRYDAAFASNPANAELKKGKRKKRASTGPKKLSAYMHCCAERRPSLTAELKASMGAAFKNPAVMTALGAEWRVLDPASKARFEQMAAVPVE